MDRIVARWTVPWLDRPLEAGRYGRWGAPVIFFPTGGAPWQDCESFGMVGALSPLIEAGRIKLYAVDAVNRDAWTRQDLPPWHKAWLQARYDEWLVSTLVPAIWRDCNGRLPIVVAGASLGAYQALNALTKHPELFSAGVGMSGTYVLDRRVGDWRGDDYYFNQPVQFVPHLGEGPQLQALRRRHFQFGLGSGPHESPDYTWWAADVLGRKGIPNHVEVWGAGSDHDWPTWHAMLPRFLDRLVA